MKNFVCALLLLAAFAWSTGCGNKEKPPAEVPKDGLKGVTPKSTTAPQPR